MTTTLLAFDFGTRKIGLASGQSLTGTGSPLPALPCREGIPDWEQVRRLLAEWQPDLLLVGLPLNMDGTDSDLSQRARRFAGRLKGRFGKPVQLIDERLSTREARDRLGDHYRGGSDPRVDSMAAVLLIESFFNDGAGEAV
ncbi:endonuclease, Holliday junction resolvase [Isoalcanivorax pacificus W11-5]|uniref:Putative pre-16S rRNA nuclease n=1 Tax=Isoalcanivorax pacificus W11-5 TaxID=391936 RepID=A0A0B4XTJ7_9GAMM|nr:Holliday junction resolvase RuvX [Isoalcanivorax pacificus]AJD50005.1 endonuclease, Holliday junction resolvase [Isoalcanivorax pacificus W11-5]